MTPSLGSGEHWGCGPLSFHFQNFLTGFETLNPKMFKFVNTLEGCLWYAKQERVQNFLPWLLDTSKHPWLSGQACNFNEKWVVLQEATQTSRAAKWDEWVLSNHTQILVLFEETGFVLFRNVLMCKCTAKISVGKQVIVSLHWHTCCFERWKVSSDQMKPGEQKWNQNQLKHGIKLVFCELMMMMMMTISGWGKDETKGEDQQLLDTISKASAITLLSIFKWVLVFCGFSTLDLGQFSIKSIWYQWGCPCPIWAKFSTPYRSDAC